MFGKMSKVIKWVVVVACIGGWTGRIHAMPFKIVKDSHVVTIKIGDYSGVGTVKVGSWFAHACLKYVLGKEERRRVGS